MDNQDNNEQVYPSLTMNGTNNEESKKFIEKMQVNENLNENTTEGFTKFKCFKNLIAISVSFFFLFSAFNSIANLQSSLNSEASLGTVSLFVIYASFSLSCLFMPSLMTTNFGYKWSLVFCQIAYCIYLISNLYTKWWTLIPAAVLLGFGAAPLWTIQGCLITNLANEYSAFTTDKSEAIIGRFFGIFMIIFQSHQAVGNLISSLVLKREKVVTISDYNATNFTYKKDLSNCGINDCPGVTSGEALTPPDVKTVYIMCGIYIGCAIIAILIIVFLLDNYKVKKSKDDLTLKEKILETILMFKDWKTWALAPLVALETFLIAFISTDISKAFVSCMLGIEYVGYWFVGFGISAALFSYLVGFLVKYIGHIPIVIFGLASTCALKLFILFWNASGEQYLILYSLAVFYGIGEAVYQTEMNALVGVFFPDSTRGAYSASRLCLALGGAIGYAYSGYLCVKIKCFIILGAVGLALISYLILEIKTRKEFRYSKVEKK